MDKNNLFTSWFDKFKSDIRGLLNKIYGRFFFKLDWLLLVVFVVLVTLLLQ
ncbi:MAG: type IV secretory pathway TrbL component [Oceanospirillaceae bacterium]|jgi:type IV secretory pathway TrbL component